MSPREPELLSAYLDDALDADERAAVESELASSSEARQELAALAEVRTFVRAAPMPAPPPGALDEIVAAVATERPARSRSGRVATWLAGAAAVAIVAGVVLVPGPSRTDPPVRDLVDQHAARSSLAEEPLSQLAPVAQPVRFEP